MTGHPVCTFGEQKRTNETYGQTVRPSAVAQSNSDMKGYLSSGKTGGRSRRHAVFITERDWPLNFTGFSGRIAKVGLLTGIADCMNAAKIEPSENQD